MKKNFVKALACSMVLGTLLVPNFAFADDDTITVTVSAYDYNAVDGGISGASSTGVILDSYSVDVAAGTTDIEAVKQAFEDNGISITVSESYYGGYYVSEVNGLSEYSNPTASPDYSGWMLEYNDDCFTNYGFGYLGVNGDGVLSDGDSIELHYSLDAGVDLGTYYNGIPVLNTLTVGDTTVSLAKTISYDENWNSIFSFTVDGEEISGTGTEGDPFVLSFDLGEVESATAAVSYTASHYYTVTGLSENADFSESLSFTVSTDSGLVAYYTVNATYTLAEVEEPTTEETSEAEETETSAETDDTSASAGDEANAWIMLFVLMAGFVLLLERKLTMEA